MRPGVGSGPDVFLNVVSLKKAKREAGHSAARPEADGESAFFRETTGCMV